MSKINKYVSISYGNKEFERLSYASELLNINITALIRSCITIGWNKNKEKYEKQEFDMTFNSVSIPNIKGSNKRTCLLPGEIVEALNNLSNITNISFSGLVLYFAMPELEKFIKEAEGKNSNVE